MIPRIIFTVQYVILVIPVLIIPYVSIRHKDVGAQEVHGASFKKYGRGKVEYPTNDEHTYLGEDHIFWVQGEKKAELKRYWEAPHYGPSKVVKISKKVNREPHPRRPKALTRYIHLKSFIVIAYDEKRWQGTKICQKTTKAQD